MSQSIDDLILSYKSQSPSAFAALAIETGEEIPNDHNQRHDTAEHGGDAKCNYCCCSEKGYCATPAQHIACWGGCIVCVACCCYATNGFNGLWTYWPFRSSYGALDICRRQADPRLRHGLRALLPYRARTFRF